MTDSFGARHKLEGVPPDFLAEHSKNLSKIRPRLMDSDERVHGLEDGEMISVGSYKLKTVLTPGHTPGNAMFWIEQAGIMLTGDHILFDITPNISVWRDRKDSLGDYLESLQKVRDYPVKLALPAHRESGNYGERIDALLQHHERRLEEARTLLRKYPDSTIGDLTPRMKWKIRAACWDEFPIMQKWFAYGEAMAHIDHLLALGEIERREKNGVRCYRMANGI